MRSLLASSWCARPFGQSTSWVLFRVLREPWDKVEVIIDDEAELPDDPLHRQGTARGTHRAPEAARWRPFRVFLDSNVIQAIHEQGEAVFEYQEFDPRLVRSGVDVGDVDALRALMFVQGHGAGAFEFALSANTLREVEDKGERSYLQWAFDLLDYWQTCLSESPAPFDGWGAGRARLLDRPSYAYLSAKDRVLIRDALALECDTFLTIERKLPRCAEHLLWTTGIVVVRPPELWRAIQPCARTGDVSLPDR